MRCLLDTNVISELRKPPRRRSAAFNRWADGLVPPLTYLSVITVLELRRGIELVRRSDRGRAEVLDGWLLGEILVAYSGRLLDVDMAVADVAARLHVPDPQPSHDALLAATAQVHGLTIATRNTADFEPMRVNTVNPWAE